MVRTRVRVRWCVGVCWGLFFPELAEDAPAWMRHAAASAQDGSAAAATAARKRLARVSNARNSAGMTALHVACLAGAERCAAALLANLV